MMDALSGMSDLRSLSAFQGLIITIQNCFDSTRRLQYVQVARCLIDSSGPHSSYTDHRTGRRANALSDLREMTNGGNHVLPPTMARAPDVDGFDHSHHCHDDDSERKHRARSR